MAGLFAFGLVQKGRKDGGDAWLGITPLLAIPFLQKIAVGALFHHVVVQLAVGNERGSLARGRRSVDDIVAGTAISMAVFIKTALLGIFYTVIYTLLAVFVFYGKEL